MVVKNAKTDTPSPNAPPSFVVFLTIASPKVIPDHPSAATGPAASMPSTNGSSTPPAAQSGIITSDTGERVVASSKRADGSVRKEIRVRPGYRPPEDVEVYKNRTAEAFKNRGKGGIPGATFVDAPKPKPTKQKTRKKDINGSETSPKELNNAKGTSKEEPAPASTEAVTEAESLDPEAEKEKEAKKLTKKLRQARDLQQKKEGGSALLPEQFQKVIQMNELIRQLDNLGFDQEGQKKP